MSAANFEFWKKREYQGDIRISKVFHCVKNDWVETKEIVKETKLPDNLVRNILHFLADTHRIARRMKKAGNHSAYQWRLENVS